MKVILLSLTLIAALSWTGAFECGRDFCHQVTCPDVTLKNCPGKFVTKGSTCGCCDACLHVLEPGQSCIGLLLVGGVAPQVTCPDGYSCDSKTATCKKNTQ